MSQRGKILDIKELDRCEIEDYTSNNENYVSYELGFYEGKDKAILQIGKQNYALLSEFVGCSTYDKGYVDGYNCFVEYAMIDRTSDVVAMINYTYIIKTFMDDCWNMRKSLVCPVKVLVG